MAQRWVNIYPDPTYSKQGDVARFISGVDHASPEECDDAGFDVENRIEVVRILTKEESDEFESLKDKDLLAQHADIATAIRTQEEV